MSDFNPKENYVDEIDLNELFNILWINKIFILAVVSCFSIISIMYALSLTNIYTAHSVLTPTSADNSSGLSNQYGGLASLAGINLNSAAATSDSYLSPLLYSKLAQSEEFSYNIIKEEIITLNGNKLTIKEYLLSNKSSFNFNPIAFVKKYTIGLFLNNKTKENNSDILKDYNFLSEEDFELVNSFKVKFTMEISEKEGYIKVIATDKNAFISTQLVEKVTKNLQSKIIELRTNKIKERLEYSKEQYEIKQVEFDFLQKTLAEFKDSNKNISTAKFMSELQKLESEYQLQQSILINLASEYNNNKIKLNKDTPIFSVIDEVSVPNEKSKPKRSLIALIWVFLGVVLSTGYLLVKEPLAELIKNIKEA